MSAKHFYTNGYEDRKFTDDEEIPEGWYRGRTNYGKGTKGYMALVDKLGNVLDEYTLTNKDDEEIEVGEKRIYAPNLVSVSNGEALQLEDGISDDLKDPYSKLTKKIKKYAYKKFECLFKCFEEEKGICQKNSC